MGGHSDEDLDDADFTLDSNSSDSDGSEVNDDGASYGPIEAAEDFILCFFYYLSSDMYEQLRKEEAASVIPEYNDDQLVHCLGLIHGAPKVKIDW